MNVYINITDNIFREKKQGLRPAIPLFYHIRDHTDELGRTTVLRDDIAKRLNVSRRTVTNWVYALVRANVIKFKYSGKCIINPEVYFSGTNEKQKEAVTAYQAFKSDI